MMHTRASASARNQLESEDRQDRPAKPTTGQTVTLCRELAVFRVDAGRTEYTCIYIHAYLFVRSVCICVALWLIIICMTFYYTYTVNSCTL